MTRKPRSTRIVALSQPLMPRHPDVVKRVPPVEPDIDDAAVALADLAPGR